LCSHYKTFTAYDGGMKKFCKQVITVLQQIEDYKLLSIALININQPFETKNNKMQSLFKLLVKIDIYMLFSQHPLQNDLLRGIRDFTPMLTMVRP
jgi:hypothetical protein